MPKRFIFRLTDARNLKIFLKDRCVCAKNNLHVQPVLRTSYADIVHRRGVDFKTPCGRFVNDFVPFYFSPSTSMAFTIHKSNVRLTASDGLDLGAASMDDIAFIVADPKKVSDFGLATWFTNIACNSGIDPEYEDDISKLESHIRWEIFDEDPRMAVINEIGYEGVGKYFADSERESKWHNRSKERMAEFLVKAKFPMELAECIILKHDKYKTDIELWIRNAGLNIPVYVKPRCYF